MRLSEFWYLLGELDEMQKKEDSKDKKRVDDVLFDSRYERK